MPGDNNVRVVEAEDKARLRRRVNRPCEADWTNTPKRQTPCQIKVKAATQRFSPSFNPAMCVCECSAEVEAFACINARLIFIDSEIPLSPDQLHPALL